MKFLVRGGKPLQGEITLAGAKNVATKLLVASLLTEEECVFENFPDIGDTEITKELCLLIGSNIKTSGNTVSIKTPRILNTKVTALSRRNRIPILALGPLLIRSGTAEVPTLGGDKIGHRPVDIHLESLEKMGAHVEVTGNSYKASAPGGLKGADLAFKYPSVGATENVIFAALRALGRTTIHNAAMEPEVMDVIKFLQKMGARIELGGEREIIIDGVPRLRGARHRVMPDRNEAVSFACLAVATGGDILVREAGDTHLTSFLKALQQIGGGYEVKNEGIRFFKKDSLRPTVIETGVHPGFMTDWQQPTAVLLTQAEGESIIHETVYEDRFGYANDLSLMGARIKVMTDCPESTPCRFKNSNFYHTAYISGSTKLIGRDLKVPDLRAGIAHLIAALIAEGESKIEGIEEIDRGYEKIDERLRNLGADIKRIV